MSKTRILIVDDEPDMLRSLSRVLKLKGYEVITASSGEEAVDAARECDPHGILMDVRMPGIDGVEACRRIRVDRPNAFVCFITAHSDAAVAAESQGDHVLTKPLDIDRLCELVASEAATRPVLIVDDDPQFSASLHRVLAREGFHIQVAHTLEEAQAQFRDNPQATVLLDIRLGASSGWDLVPTLRSVNPDVCVIAISALAIEEAGAEHSIPFLPKPLDLQQLISTLQNSISGA